MPYIMLGHVSADAESAQLVSQRLRALEVVSGSVAVVLDGAAPNVSFGADVMFAMLWSERAAVSEETYANLLDSLHNPAFLICLDETPLGPALAQHRLLTIAFDANDDGLKQAVRYAPLGHQRAARRIVRTRPAEPQNLTPRRTIAMRAPLQVEDVRRASTRDYVRLFASRAALGFVSSVATLGIGALAAVNLQPQLDAFLPSAAEAHSGENAQNLSVVGQAPAAPRAAMDVFEPMPVQAETPILDRQSLEAQAATLRAVATAQRLAIERHLESASGNLVGSRTNTLDVVDQMGVIAAESPTAAAPVVNIPEPVLMSDPQPRADFSVKFGDFALLPVEPDYKFVEYTPDSSGDLISTASLSERDANGWVS